MKTKFFFALACAMCIVFASCEKATPSEPPTSSQDTTLFTRNSIIGTWACIASDNATYDILSGQTSYHWNYDPNATKYDVYWYFDIKSDAQVQYIEGWDEEDFGEYRKSDGYLHLPANSEWRILIDANYIFDEKTQSIRCPSGKIFGFFCESVADVLGTDTIFFLRRYGKDKGVIMDNTGWLQSQYVVRVKGIKKDF